MKLWLSAEVHHDVSEALRQARIKVEPAINAGLASDYGPAVDNRWTVITILRPRIPRGWGEVCKYHRRDRVAEFRLIIDYSEFKVASPQEQTRMLVESILRSVDLFPTLKVEGFDVDRFRRDIVAAATAADLIAAKPSSNDGAKPR